MAVACLTVDLEFLISTEYAGVETRRLDCDLQQLERPFRDGLVSGLFFAQDLVLDHIP